MTISRGQQIEILDPPVATPKLSNEASSRDPNEWTFVRLSHAHDREGWVPLSVLRQPPKQHSRNDLELPGKSAKNIQIQIKNYKIYIFIFYFKIKENCHCCKYGATFSLEFTTIILE